MKKNNLSKTKLPRQAETKLSRGTQKKVTAPGMDTDTLHLVHKLQAHQIKLEKQNETLIRSQEKMEAALRQYTDLYDFAPMGYFTLSRDGTIHHANLNGALLLGVERDALIERRFGIFVSSESHSTFNTFLGKVFDSHEKETCEIVLLKNGREPIWTRIEAACSDASCEQGTCHIVVSDITEHKRTENILQTRFRITKFAAEHSLDALLQNALDELCALTDSPIGFFHFVEPDQRTLSLQAWSTRTLNEMCTAEGKGKHYDIDQAGVWVDCMRESRPVIHNDYASLPASRRKGLPQGHAPLIREMVFPIIRSQKIVAIIGVGNKLQDYTEDDVAYVLRLADLIWDITERKRAEEALRESEARYLSILEDQTELICRYLPDGRLSFVNDAYARYYGETAQKLINTNFIPHIPEPDISIVIGKIAEITPQEPAVVYEHRIIKSDGEIRWHRWTHRGIYDANGNLVEHQAVGNDITERKRAEEMIEKRIVALTQPLEGGTLTFEELFNLDEIQRTQDGFAQATGVASIITQIDGTPITAPSNFVDLCSKIIRKTEKGCSNCFKSDAAIGRYYPDGPIVQSCLSGGLWDAGTAITVGGQHIANWLIGQVRDEAQTEEKMRSYAREIGADEEAFMKAFHEVPAMSREQFERIAKALFTLANQLSTSAYQNVQQARFITERKQAEEKLRHYLSELKVLYDNGLAISALLEPREIGRKIIETLSNNLAWHHIVIRLRRGETDDLELIAFNQPNVDGQEAIEAEKRLNALISKVGEGLSGWSVQIGHAIRTGNVQKHTQYVDTFSGVRSGMYIPLTVGERVIGSIAVESETENAFTEQDERLLTTLAAQTAIAFENARLYQNIQRELLERERAEAALANEKAFTETALDSQRDTFFVFEPVSGRAIHWNKIFRDITGYSDEEIASLKAPDSYFSPEDLEKAAPAFESIMLNGNGRIELCLICKDGRKIPVEYEVSVIQEKTGETNYIITIGRDVTERKQAEEQIQLLAKFPAEDPNPVLRVARDGTLRYVNEAGLSLLPRWNLQVGEAVPPILQEAIFHSMRNGMTQTLDIEHGDRLFAFYVAPIVSAGYANLYGHDITESRQVKALQDAKARYHVLFEQSPYGVVLADPNTGKIIEANEIASRQLGYTDEEFSNMKIFDYEASEKPEQTAQHLQKITREGSDNFETLHRAKSGEIRNVYVWVKTLQMNDRVLFYAILQDITERKRMEEANEAYNREITLLEERQRIASDLHDAVSQTLFSARLTTEMLLRQPDRQADSFTHSLMDLNRLARSAAGELRLILIELRNNAFLNVSLNTLLADLIDSGMARTSANLVFQCYVDDLILPSQIKLAFYRIAQEAVSNAIKHGKPANINCILRENGPTLEMIIQDDGTGFLIDKVSDDHFGLQIMRERADLAGVELTIATQPGNGTSVTVWWQEEKT